MALDNEMFRPIETAPQWSDEVFDTCAELAELLEEAFVSLCQDDARRAPFLHPQEDVAYRR